MRLKTADVHPEAAWQTSVELVQGCPVTVWTKPGLFDHQYGDQAHRLLAETLDVGESDVVLNLHCGAGLVGVVAAKLAPAGRVILTTAHLGEREAAARTLASSGVTNAEVVLSSGTSRLGPEPIADVVVARLPKGRLPSLQCIWDAFVALRPGGRFYVAGANDEGIQSALTRVGALFGNVATLTYRKGCRVGSATKAELSPPTPSEFLDPLLDHQTFHRYAVEVRDRRFEVASRPGVFSWDGLDPGTRRLVDAMTVAPRDDVLDLGCGTGIVGAAASALARSGRVYLVDVDIDAVDSARETVAANGAANCTVLASDSIAAVRELRFDAVVTNPPFHVSSKTDLDVTRQFMTDVRPLLKRTGRFYLVANTFLPYEEPLRQIFGSVEPIFLDRHYKVLLAEASRR